MLLIIKVPLLEASLGEVAFLQVCPVVPKTPQLLPNLAHCPVNKQRNSPWWGLQEGSRPIRPEGPTMLPEVGSEDGSEE